MTERERRHLIDTLNNAARCIDAMNVERAPGATIVAQKCRDQVSRLRAVEQSAQVYRSAP